MTAGEGDLDCFFVRVDGRGFFAGEDDAAGADENGRDRFGGMACSETLSVVLRVAVRASMRSVERVCVLGRPTRDVTLLDRGVSP